MSSDAAPWKEWLLLFVSAPAAFGFLGKIDDRISFGPLLTRMILGYKEVSRALWQAVSPFLPFLQGVDHLLLSFIALILVPSIAYIAASAFRPKPRRNLYWALLSEVSVVVVATSFHPGLLFIVMFAGALVGASEYASKRIQVVDEAMRPAASVFTFVGILMCSMVLFLLITWASTGSYNRGEKAVILALLVGLFAVIHFAVARGMRSPGYLVLIALGVFCFDWLADAAVPALDGWLDSAGA